jgi:hypothetical protein
MEKTIESARHLYFNFGQDNTNSGAFRTYHHMGDVQCVLLPPPRCAEVGLYARPQRPWPVTYRKQLTTPMAGAHRIEEVMMFQREKREA